MWDYLARNDLLKNTMVIILSDHGEELFDHGEGNHSSFHEHTARVPWLIALPDGIGQDVDQMMSLVDVLPTAFEILGWPVPEQAQGHSAFQTGGQNFVFGSSLGITYISDQEWKLVRGEQGQLELYNLRLDPREKNNVAALRLPKIKNVLARLSGQMDNMRLQQAL